MGQSCRGHFLHTLSTITLRTMETFVTSLSISPGRLFFSCGIEALGLNITVPMSKKYIFVQLRHHLHSSWNPDCSISSTYITQDTLVQDEKLNCTCYSETMLQMLAKAFITRSIYISQSLFLKIYCYTVSSLN